MTSCAILSRTRQAGEQGRDVGLGAHRAGRSESARASGPRRRPARRPAGSLPVRGTWRAQNSRRAGTLRMVAGLRRARPRGPGADARRGAARDRRPAHRQPGGGARPPRRSGDQSGGRGCPGSQRRGATAGGRRAARGAVQSRARLPRRGRSGRHGRFVHRFGHRSTNLQSLRPEYRPHRCDARRHRPAAGRSARRGRAVLHLPVHDGRGDAVGGAGAASGSSCSTGRTRSARRCRATCSTRRTRTPVGLLAVPMRYGMTLGELARLARADLGLATDLSVVPVAGWRRADAARARPGCRSSRRARTSARSRACTTTPGICLFEGTNLSVGRGSDAPFEQIGAPWLDTRGGAGADAGARPPGSPVRGRRRSPRAARATASTPTPRSRGSGSEVTDRAAYDPTATAVYLLAAIRAAHGDRFGWIPQALRPAGRRPDPAGAARGRDRSRRDRARWRRTGAFRERRRRSAVSG